MKNVNLNDPTEIRVTGMKALSETLGPVGTVRFIQQFESGYGNYTKEKQSEESMSLNEIDVLLSREK